MASRTSHAENGFTTEVFMAIDIDSTRGHERLDPLWHSRIDTEDSVEGIVTLARDYLAGLTPEQLTLLPEAFRAMRIKAEDDIEYWTYRLSAIRPEDRRGSSLSQDILMHLLHASLRIGQIHRLHAVRPGEASRISL
jgi:hypothetical protein